MDIIVAVNNRITLNNKVAVNNRDEINVMIKKIFLVFLTGFFVACTSDNEHFCVRYEYLYTQLDDPDVPPFSEIYSQLQQDLKDPNKDKNHTKMMLFVLKEFQQGIKPDHESAKDYCVRRKRWEAYNR